MKNIGYYMKITKHIILEKDAKTTKATCFAISLIILSSIVTSILFLNDSGYTTTASAEISNSNLSTSNTNINGSSNIINNDTITNTSKKYQQQLFSAPRTHEYTLITENTTLEIAPGLRVDAWTYNGTIPGPTITATEGDRVIIHFINKTPLPHTVHLHGDHPSEQDGVFELVGANKTYTYDFIAQPQEH